MAECNALRAGQRRGFHVIRASRRDDRVTNVAAHQRADLDPGSAFTSSQLLQNTGRAISKPRFILTPGRNCWRIERANKFAVIIDAANYFPAAKEAILKATHSVYLIGWDFDTRIKFEPENPRLEGPNKLGAFLRWIAKRRPGLNIYVLKWDLGVLQALGRGTTPLAVLNWLTSRRIRFKLDGAHPLGAAHHQKIVVVDDCIAFCGGIDMTADRWDTPDHLDDDPRRRRPSGRSYGPWHDMTTMVDGGVAAALGELARERWRRATGESLDRPPARDPIWPERIEPTFKNVDVGIARTSPELEDYEPVREIETLYLDAIAKARRCIYAESQYFASRRIAEAIAARLKEEAGPEVVIVNPISGDGFLEAAVMDSARARLLAMVQSADRHGRFGIYTPVTESRNAIYVHAKLLIVDDCLLRVGSSNFNNRSMGFDTECDLAIEAAPGQEQCAPLRERIGEIRSAMLAEHLGTSPDAVRRALESCDGSLIRSIESLRGENRSLVPYKPDEPRALEKPLADSELLDPEGPTPWMQALRSQLSGINPLR